MWHPDFVTKEEALTELLDALADTSPDAEEQRNRRIAAAFYEAAKADQEWGWQKRLASKTGLSRETIRRHIEDERIRREEIPPTPRYLAEQERAAKRRAAREP
jgi:hypothetical protein